MVHIYGSEAPSYFNFLLGLKLIHLVCGMISTFPFFIFFPIYGSLIYGEKVPKPSIFTLFPSFNCVLITLTNEFIIISISFL